MALRAAMFEAGRPSVLCNQPSRTLAYTSAPKQRPSVGGPAVSLYFRPCDIPVALPAHTLAAAVAPQFHGQFRSDDCSGVSLGTGGHLLERDLPEDAIRGCRLRPEPGLGGWQQTALDRESHGHREGLPCMGHRIRDSSCGLPLKKMLTHSPRRLLYMNNSDAMVCLRRLPRKI